MKEGSKREGGGSHIHKGEGEVVLWVDVVAVMQHECTAQSTGALARQGASPMSAHNALSPCSLLP